MTELNCEHPYERLPHTRDVMLWQCGPCGWWHLGVPGDEPPVCENCGRDSRQCLEMLLEADYAEHVVISTSTLRRLLARGNRHLEKHREETTRDL